MYMILLSDGIIAQAPSHRSSYYFISVLIEHTGIVFTITRFHIFLSNNVRLMNSRSIETEQFGLIVTAEARMRVYVLYHK